MLLHFAAKLSSTSSFSPAPTSPTLRALRTLATLDACACCNFFHTTHHIVAAIAALPRACSPHGLVKINFYSINFFSRLGADAAQHSLRHIIRCVHHSLNLIRSKVFSNRKLLSPRCVANTSHPCGTLATLDFASVKFPPHRFFASAKIYVMALRRPALRNTSQPCGPLGVFFPSS